MKNNRYTFWKLISEKKIVIPIIQRDYAQGREKKEYVRKNILEQLGKGLFDNQPTELDFVYGTEARDKGLDTIRMYPLDGQQRLTTLWLLHWYIAYKANKLEEKANGNGGIKFKDILKNFSYETRTSSREFCEKLCELKYQKTDNIVDLIKNQTWFFSAWKQDPTIQAMLRMLNGTNNSKTNDRLFVDGIEILFKGKDKFEDYWEVLIKPECPIHFKFLPLQSSELPMSDELYIKMNARGKALTSFENFKAELVDWIYKDKYKEFWGTNNDEQNSNRAALISAIDNQWTDIFWNNTKNIGKVDEIYFAFLNRYFYNLVITDKRCNLNDKNASENKYYAYFNSIDKNMLFEDFGLYEYFLSQGKHIIGYIANVLKNYSISIRCYGEDIIERILQCEWDNDFHFIPKYKIENGNTVRTSDYAGNEIMDFSTINQKERVVFYAVCKYFNEGPIEKKNKIETESDGLMSLKRWMRFVWNLVSGFDGKGQSVIRNINAMQEAISYIDSITESHKVYEELEKRYEKFLSNCKIDGETALKRCFQEEIVKARQILSTLNNENVDKTWEDTIIDAEKYAFFCGAIRFLFTNKYGNIDWSEFKKKWKNIQSLIPEKEYRHCTKEMLPYLSDDEIKCIFYNCTLSNSDENLRKLLLTYSSYMHEWLLQRNKSQDKLSLLHSHLDSVIEEYPDFWIHPNWIHNLDILSNYVNRSGDYQNQSIVVGSDILGKAIEVLSNLDDITITFPESKVMPIIGLYIKFTYKYLDRDYSFRWQTSNWVDMYEDDKKLYDREGEYKQLHTHYGDTSEFCFNDSNELVKELNRCIKKYADLNDFKELF